MDMLATALNAYTSFGASRSHQPLRCEVLLPGKVRRAVEAWHFQDRKSTEENIAQHLLIRVASTNHSAI